MNKQNEVVIFGLDVFSDINLSIDPTISSSDGLISAKQNLPFPITARAGLARQPGTSTRRSRWIPIAPSSTGGGVRAGSPGARERKPGKISKRQQPWAMKRTSKAEARLSTFFRGSLP